MSLVIDRARAHQPSAPQATVPSPSPSPSAPADAPARRPAPAARLAFGREPWAGGAAAWLLYSALGVWMAYRYGAMRDTLAHLANAYYVLFSRDPHPAAIGFIWNPLPSMLALPLVALKGLWPELATRGIAADLVTALCGGVTVFYWLRLMRRVGLPRRLRWTVTALFALNPAIAFYAANGMSDLILMAALVAAVDGLWGYLHEESVPDLLASGVWVAVGFLTRYDAVIWAVVVAGMAALALGRAPYQGAAPAERWEWVRGFLLLWLTPLTYAATAWIFANWAIMHDPLYFLRGAYSNTAQNATGHYAWAPLAAARSLGGALAFIAHQTLLFPPVALGALALLGYGLVGRGARHRDALILVAAALGVPLLQVLLLSRGESDGWLRYFISYVPFGFLTVVYALRLVPPGRAGRAAWTLGLAALAAGDVASFSAALTPRWHFRYETPATFAEVDPIVAYLDAHPRLTVLTDSFLAFPIVLRVHRPARLVITSDRDFTQALNHPRGRVDAVLVPEPQKTGLGQLDAVNVRYPTLWRSGEPWARLTAQFPLRAYSSEDYHWRLYSLRPGQAQGGRPGSTTTAPAACHCPARRGSHD